MGKKCVQPAKNPVACLGKNIRLVHSLATSQHFSTNSADLFAGFKQLFPQPNHRLILSCQGLVLHSFHIAYYYYYLFFKKCIHNNMEEISL